MNQSLVVGCIFVSLCLAQPLPAQQTDAAKRTKDDPFQESRRDAEKMTVRLDNKELKLRPGPLYTYDEAIRAWNKGTSWVWGERGRPVVFVNMVTPGNTRYNEFVSLTSGKLHVDTGYGPAWLPKPSWNPKVIEKAPPPSPSRRGRLIQMRALARRFTADQTDSSGTVRRLRLLPQPIYRYADETGESLDGGIFAMVREGDLEIILIIEATKTEDGPAEWWFDCMPVSVDHQVVQLDGTRAWERQRISFVEAQVPRGAYYLFMRPARAAETAEGTQR